jgi:hypothetical protein
MGASVWIGPAIVAAVIAAIGGFITLALSHRQSIRRDQMRRAERVQDVQTAIRAEIRANLQRLQSVDIDKHAEGTFARMRASADFTPFIPREAPNAIFTAVLTDIQILPTSVIDSVVVYYDQLSRIGQFSEDMRSDQFRLLGPDRKTTMYGDYIAMLKQAEILAVQAIDTINDAIERGTQ